MTSHLRRRVALFAASLLALAAPASLAAGPASAAPVKSKYTCSAEGLNQTLDLDFEVSTTAPATAYVGKTLTPKLVVKVTIPANIVGLAAFFGVKSASATGTFIVKSNGTPYAAPFVFPRTDIPQSAKAFPVSITAKLAPLTRKVPGTVVYTPGKVALSLTGYNKKTADAAEGDEVGTVAAQCTSQQPNKAIDTVKFVKSATRTAVAAAYGKAAKRVVSSAKVTSVSGVAPTGAVTATLYRGTTKVKSKTVPLAGGAASFTFNGIGAKGTYKVVTTYAGSSALLASSGTRSFVIR